VGRASRRILRFLPRGGVVTLVSAPGDGEVTVVSDETMTGESIAFESSDVANLEVRLSDAMLDPGQPVVVAANGAERWNAKATRTGFSHRLVKTGPRQYRAGTMHWSRQRSGGLCGMEAFAIFGAMVSGCATGGALDESGYRNNTYPNTPQHFSEGLPAFEHMLKQVSIQAAAAGPPPPVRR